MSNTPGSPQKLPRSVLSASRIEFHDKSLDILAGSLPKDLKGHFFFIGPVGSVESGGLPYAKGDPIFNGDGMVFRLDFGESQPTLSSRLVKSPDFYADEATQKIDKFRSLAFKNHGVSRFSLNLGMRNQLNTAFVPMQRQGSDKVRLLVTFDAGRHYEIDPQSLDLITPIGRNREWQPETHVLSPFQPVLSTAHPVHDGRTGELFTVNYGRAIASFMKSLPWMSYFKQGFSQGFQALKSFFKIKPSDFTYLIRWDGQGDFERWRLVLPDGSPIKIKQSLHQIGLTRHHVILIDTSFSIGLAQIFNNPFPHQKHLERILRRLFSNASSPDSAIYVIRRADLQQGQRPLHDKQDVSVTVQPLSIPMEVLHFAVDYEDTADAITLHLGHICADDAAAWIRKFDVTANPSHDLCSPSLGGMQTAVMDVSRLGRYVVNPQTGCIVTSKILSDMKLTWGVEFYTYNNYPNLGTPTDKIDNLYWTSFGCWPELLTKFSVDLLKNYKYRAISTDTLLNWSENQQGQPASLFRLNTNSMAIEDSYQFLGNGEYGSLANSPQFIPKQKDLAETSQTKLEDLHVINSDSALKNDEDSDGYLVCTVFTAESSEIWIFDSASLASGPICRLGHPLLNFGFTLHSAWLPSLERDESSYCINVRQDYQDLVSRKGHHVQQLFEEHIYPHFERSPNN